MVWYHNIRNWKPGKIREHWRTLPEATRVKIVGVLDFGFTALSIAVPIYFFMSIWMPHSWARFGATLISLWTMIPTVEHYCRWKDE